MQSEWDRRVGRRISAVPLQFGKSWIGKEVCENNERIFPEIKRAESRIFQRIQRFTMSNEYHTRFASWRDCLSA